MKSKAKPAKKLKPYLGIKSKFLLGFYWRLTQHEKAGPALVLMSPANKEAATVFLHRDHYGHNWYAWGKKGAELENSCADLVADAMLEAEASTIRWRQHK